MMQIIIDIDDNLYTRLFDNGDEYVADMRRACVAIRKGTPLPKGHGRLYDEKAIRKEIKNPYQCETVLDGLKLVKPIFVDVAGSEEV